MTFHRWVVGSLLAIILFTGSLTSAVADRPLLPANVLQAYKNECASCHIAYPPAMLPSSSWQRIMDNLGRHYGADASLDVTTERHISNWLRGQSGTYKQVEATSPGDRLTTTKWFEKKHRKIQDTVWARKSINGKAQCQACHQDAIIGNFEDERVRIPQ